MKIYIGSDHAGFELKQKLAQTLKEKGQDILDLGTFDAVNKTDYPDIAREVAEKVLENADNRGVLVCGSGIGVAIAANKIKGIRAANVYDVTEAKLSRQHNDANIVTLGERLTGEETAREIVDTFLSTAFEGGRHQIRVDKIKALEENQ